MSGGRTGYPITSIQQPSYQKQILRIIRLKKGKLVVMEMKTEIKTYTNHRFVISGNRTRNTIILSSTTLHLFLILVSLLFSSIPSVHCGKAPTTKPDLPKGVSNILLHLCLLLLLIYQLCCVNLIIQFLLSSRSHQIFPSYNILSAVFFPPPLH